MSFPYTPLPWHPAAHALIAAARAGGDNVAFIGPAGSGKSDLLRKLASGVLVPDGPGAVRVLSEANAAPAADMHVVLLGRAHTPFAMLDAIMAACRAQIGPRVRRKGTTVVLHHVAQYLAGKGIGLIVLDEVQHASPEALFHALLLRDECEHGCAHALRVVLLGTPEATAVVEDTGQLGQRMPVVFPVPLLSPDELRAVAGAHAPLVRALRTLPKREAEACWQALFEACGGSIRRLVDIVNRAERFAAEEGVPLQARHVWLAIDLQA